MGKRVKPWQAGLLNTHCRAHHTHNSQKAAGRTLSHSTDTQRRQRHANNRLLYSVHGCAAFSWRLTVCACSPSVVAVPCYDEPAWLPVAVAVAHLIAAEQKADDRPLCEPVHLHSISTINNNNMSSLASQRENGTAWWLVSCFVGWRDCARLFAQTQLPVDPSHSVHFRQTNVHTCLWPW